MTTADRWTMRVVLVLVAASLLLSAAALWRLSARPTYTVTATSVEIGAQEAKP